MNTVFMTPLKIIKYRDNCVHLLIHAGVILTADPCTSLLTLTSNLPRSCSSQTRLLPSSLAEGARYLKNGIPSSLLPPSSVAEPVDHRKRQMMLKCVGYANEYDLFLCCSASDMEFNFTQVINYTSDFLASKKHFCLPS